MNGGSASLISTKGWRLGKENLKIEYPTLFSSVYILFAVNT